MKSQIKNLKKYYNTGASTVYPGLQRSGILSDLYDSELINKAGLGVAIPAYPFCHHTSQKLYIGGGLPGSRFFYGEYHG